MQRTVSLRRSRSGSKTFWLTTMMLPTTVWLLLIRYLPMFGIMMSFLDYKLPTRKVPFPLNLLQSPWVGLKNFQFLFSSESVTMIRNTIGYNALWIVLGLLISVTFAIMMSELTRKFLAKTYQTMMFFPYFLSWVVVSYFLFAFLDPTNGMIVRAQKAAGGTVVDWYNTPGYWPYILTICSMWKNTGYSTVLYLSAITGIDRSQYEAAAVDGATKWQQMIHVTLPQVRPDELGAPVPRHPGRGHLRLPRLHLHRQRRHEYRGGLPAKPGRLYLHHGRERHRPSAGSRQQPVLTHKERAV